MTETSLFIIGDGVREADGTLTATGAPAAGGRKHSLRGVHFARDARRDFLHTALFPASALVFPPRASRPRIRGITRCPRAAHDNSIACGWCGNSVCVPAPATAPCRARILQEQIFRPFFMSSTQHLLYRLFSFHVDGKWGTLRLD